MSFLYLPPFHPVSAIHQTLASLHMKRDICQHVRHWYRTHNIGIMLPQGALQSVQHKTPCMCARRLLNICENMDPDRQLNSLRWSRLTMEMCCVPHSVSGTGSWSSYLLWTSSPPGGEITVDGIRDSRVFRDGEKWIQFYLRVLQRNV